mgnify:CR=1 FL=1
MPQETNLNVNPYFDDFDKNKNFYKVLFKPGSPIQARELTGLQSILQNQIEQFGSHMFKEGAKVIPGNTTFDNNYTCIQIESNFLGIPVSSYIDQLVGVRITGATSEVTATVRKVLLEEDSIRDTLTLYIKYEQSGAEDGVDTFQDGESLLTGTNIVYGASVIAANEPFANTLAADSNATGSAFSVSEGVYFIRGTFAQVNTETLLLDQYGSTPSYRIGFNVEESFVTADEDPSLNDNASGFTNFAAPGADRLQMNIRLEKKDLENFNDQNFIEISRIEEGVIQTFIKETNYNLINDTLAKRTYDESGNYYINPFAVHVRESLDDGIGSDGIFTREELTSEGNTPSNDLLTIKVSPGKAYVKGYELERLATTFLDVPKPRTTREVLNEGVSYSTGDPLIVNNVFGSPSLGIGTTATVSLMSRRKGENSGTEIGLARVYDFQSESDKHKDATTQYELRLFDVKTFTTVRAGTALTSLSVGDRIQGKRSGAVGYVRSSVTNGRNISLTDVTGKFIRLEGFTINGVNAQRTLTKVDTFGFDDVASVESAVGVSTFSADVVLDDATKLTSMLSGNFKLTKTGANKATITSAGKNFVGIITSDNIVSYTVPGETVPTFNRITGVTVDGDAINLRAIPTVTGVANGGIGTNTSLFVNDLLLLKPSFDIGENNFLTPVSNPDIESIDVTNTTLQIRKQYTDISVNNGEFTTPTAGKDLFFQPFDEERYFLSYDDGSIESLTSDNLIISDDKKTVTFVGISTTVTKANLFATVLKSKVTTKQKKLNEANILIIDRSSSTASGIGTNTLNDGLTHHNAYGTRVQDEKICLNVPDAVELLGVFESRDNSEPDLPSLTLSGFSGPNSSNQDLILGEQLTGLDSDAIVSVVERSGTTAVGVINLNEEDFIIGETVRGSKSGVTATVAAVAVGDRDLTDFYSLNTGQKPTFYDYSFIERAKTLDGTQRFETDNAGAPERKLKIVFKNFFVESSDTGDFYSATSYPDESKPLITVDPDYQQLLTDLIDLRPRVAPYDPSSSSTSPFSYSSRQFTTTGDGSLNPLVSDELLIVNYNYYLGRIDKLFFDKNGEFVYLQGVPSEDPEEPSGIGDAIEIAKLTLPPYLQEVSQVQVERTKHKRFTMADIGRLEKRIENVEYYTRLSMLELETSTLEVTDANGLNRFKCGFFVDNFKKHENHQIGHPDFSASTDLENGYLRPGHFTTCIDLVPASKRMFGIDGRVKTVTDLKYANDISGTNNRHTIGGGITIDYSEVVMVRQRYASRIENVNPFLIAYYDGDVKLFPDSDTWVSTKKIDANIIHDTSEYDLALLKHGINAKTGLSEVEWGAWQTDWVGKKVKGTYVETIKKQELGKVKPKNKKLKGAKMKVKHVANGRMTRKLNGRWIGRGKGVIINAVLKTKQKYKDIKVTTKKSREGIQYKVTPRVTKEVIGEKIVSSDKVPYMRKRQIEVTATGLKPRTRFYPFFDGRRMDGYCSPKLVEIEMQSGVFQVGEIVEGEIDFGDRVDFGDFNRKIHAPLFKKGQKDELVCRICQPNHKEGPFNKPTKTYKKNPYNPKQTIPSRYSQSSTILNIDTFSLVNMADDEFLGKVRGGMRLIGQTSGAEAVVRGRRGGEDERLGRQIYGNRFITDSFGYLKLVMSIPDPKFKKGPKFETGVKTFRLTPSRTNTEIPGGVKSHGEANFYAQGTLNTVQETVMSTKLPKIKKLSVQDQKVLNKTISRKVGGKFKELTGIQYYDPLAQTFRVDESSGVFLTSVTVFFRDKDDEIPVTVQLRTVETGFPTSKILPFSVVSKDPDEVNVSEDGSVGTRFTFDSPVYVEGSQEYAIVLVTPSENYSAWISRMGEVDISTAKLPDSQQVIISQAPYLGSLFKSQNGTTWDASQLEDLKFVLRKAKFNIGSPATVRVFSPRISVANNLIESLPANSVKFLSRKATIGLGTFLPAVTEGLIPGVIIKQAGNESASATLLNTAGIATINGSNDLTIINPGVGYTPSTAVQTYSNVPTVTLTGSGSGAIADVTIDNGVVGAVTFTSGGNGYVVGDTVGLGTIGLGNGSGDIISVGLITARNTLFVDKVQGTFNIGVGTVTYNNGSVILSLDGKTGIGTTIDGSDDQVGTATTISTFEVDPIFDGQHMVVQHRAHGMHSDLNRISIKGIQPDTPITTLTSDYGRKSTGNISVVDSSSFSTFEGVAVGTTNYGYAMINGLEIVAYTGVAEGQITGITTRGIGPRSFMVGGGGGQRTPKKSYKVGAQIQKYEIAGVNLRRINCFHNFRNTNTNLHPITLDEYTLRIIMSDNKGLNSVSPGEDRSGNGSLPALFFKETKNDGGTVARHTENIQYETLTPNVQTSTPPGTTISAKVRTISGTSIGGSEESFQDQGFEDITLDEMNHFETPRLIASAINEDANLRGVMPANKSLLMEFTLTSDDENISPMIDSERMSAVLSSNRLSDGNFNDDSFMKRTKTTGEDPNTATYVSNMVMLDSPATSILLEFSGYRTEGSSIRAFYKTLEEGSSEDSFDRNFEAFPGFSNIDQFEKVIDPNKNTGEPDQNVPPSVGDEFLEYSFNSRVIPAFTAFQIKVVMVGNNQAKPPKIKELRGISFA